MSARVVHGPCLGCARQMRNPWQSREAGRLHHSRGRCAPCVAKMRRAGVQPLGTPRARRVPADVLRDEVPFLRSTGASDAEIARRLGMKPLSFRRAIERAGLAA